jgi:hypothetical protein
MVLTIGNDAAACQLARCGKTPSFRHYLQALAAGNERGA